MATLHPWQVPLADRAESSLRSKRFHVLATCTGSGKSYISAEVIRRLDRPTLIICPKAAVTQSRRCMEAMGASHLLLDVVNPSQLIVSRKCGWYDPETLWHLPKDACVVWDEIHRGCSGIDSQATLACARLKAFGASLLALSATAACDPLHMRALGWWGGMHSFAYGDFVRWCMDHGCYRADMNGRKVLKFTRNKRRAAEIMRGIRADFGDAFQSLGPDEIEGFPEETLEVLLVDLSARDRKEIDEAYAAMSLRLRTPGKSDLAELMRERERIEFTMAASLAERAVADSESGLSPVVFFNFTSSRERFEELVRKGGVTGIASVHGGQGDAERQAAVDGFNSNSLTVASVNLAAGGCALSMHDVLRERQRVSYLLPSYNASEVLQALGRIRRVGGTAVVQRFVIAAGTLMERVADALRSKISAIGGLNGLDDSDLMSWDVGQK